MSKKTPSILDCKNLKKYFQVQSSIVHAVDGVDLTIQKGERMGLVGESGCGKSTLGYLITGFFEPTEGEILFEGKNIFNSSKNARAQRHIQMIYQSPQESLDPRMKIASSVCEPIDIHLRLSREEKRETVRRSLESVGLDESHAEKYPHELSGGQLQRVVIARALVLNPKLLVLDEPTSHLDVSVQAKILNLLKEIKDKHELSYLFISHDLGVIRNVTDRVAVMYLGKIVEVASREEMFKSPAHPYTQALLSAAPNPDPRVRVKHIILKGEVPSSVNIPSGCRFHPRCQYRKTECSKTEPELSEINKEHALACHLTAEVQTANQA